MNHEQQPVETAQPVPVPPATPTPPVASAPSNGLAIASLIVGIFAFLTSWVPLLSIIAGAVAIVLGCLALKRLGGKGLAIAGISTGGAGALFGLFTTALAVIAIVGLAGYDDAMRRGAQNPKSNSTQNDSSNELNKGVPLDIKTAFKAGEVGVFGDLEVKVNSVNRANTPPEGTVEAPTDKKFVTINLTVKNVGETSKYTSYSSFRINNGTSTTIRPTYTASNSEISAMLAPGETATGSITYAVEEGKNNLKLQMRGMASAKSDYYRSIEYTLDI